MLYSNIKHKYKGYNELTRLSNINVILSCKIHIKQKYSHASSVSDSVVRAKIVLTIYYRFMRSAMYFISLQFSHGTFIF